MNKFELADRTLKFSQEVIVMCGSLPQTSISRPIISQLIRSATSIGANYREANGAPSKKDFRNKIHLCKKEAQETEYWLEIIKSHNRKIERVDFLLDESRQLVLIFGKITSTLARQQSPQIKT